MAQDGGDIVYRGFRDGTVFLALHGACAGCPSSTMTLKQGIEKTMMAKIPAITAVRDATDHGSGTAPFIPR